VTLSDYTGLTPESEPELVVGRVAQHHRWTMNDTETTRCRQCETTLDLHERHLLVTLSKESRSLPAGRRYLCNERCLREWLGAE
jgi:hypothetical protein